MDKMRFRITIVGVVQFLLVLWIVLRMIFAPIPGVQAQGPINAENWREFVADGATIAVWGNYPSIFDWVKAVGPGASGYSVHLANGQGLAVGFDPIQVQSQVRAVAQIPAQVKQSTPQEFTPGWGAYSGTAYWMARHGTLPPPSASTWFSSAIPMFGGLTTTQWALQQWWLRASYGAYGTWQW